MHLQIKQELEKFIDEQVRSGRFPTRAAAIEAAIKQMMLDREAADLDDETAAAINRAEEQIDRGEGIEFEKFAAKMREKSATGQ